MYTKLKNILHNMDLIDHESSDAPCWKQLLRGQRRRDCRDGRRSGRRKIALLDK